MINGQLPEERVKTIIIGQRYKLQLESVLKRYQIDVIGIPDNPNLDKRIAGHADLSVLNVKDGVILSEHLVQCIELINFLETSKIHYKFERVDLFDSRLNSCVLGSKIIAGKRSFTDLSCSPEIIYVRQKYARCSTCIVNDNSIITADMGIAKAARKNGIDVLKIEEGHINLKGFEYGFIGGSSFKISKEEIAFTGNIELHPNINEIKAFLAERNIKPVSLLKSTLEDIGSAALLT